jgi:hypothetical protein
MHDGRTMETQTKKGVSLGSVWPVAVCRNAGIEGSRQGRDALED